MHNNSQIDENWMAKTIDTDGLIKKMMPDTSFLNKSYDTEGFFKQLVENLKNKPIWVKQAIYVELRDDIKQTTNVDLLETLDKSNLLQLYIPRLTHAGEKALNDKLYAQSIGLNENVISLLSKIDGKRNVIDLCYVNRWTLKHFSETLIRAEEKSLIENIRSNQIINLFYYLADQLDLGNLLVRLNKITSEQFTFAEFNLSELNKTFDDEGNNNIETVLIRLGYITEDKINSLVLLKRASNLILDEELDSSTEDLMVMQENISILADENKHIQAELNAFKPLLEAKDKRIRQLEEEVAMYKEELGKLQQNPQLMDVFKKL